MMFQPGKFYRHSSTLDMDMYVQSYLRDKEGHDLLVRYWNRHYMMFMDDKVDRVLVKFEDENKWKCVGDL